MPWLTEEEYLDDILKDINLVIQLNCQCGAQHTSFSHLHSDYCPLYNKHQILRQLPEES